MPGWLKNLFIIVVLGGWAATVGKTLWSGGLPDATTLGIPAAVLLALAPPVTIGRNRNRDDSEEPPNETERAR